jgi:hypothetical protein
VAANAPNPDEQFRWSYRHNSLAFGAQYYVAGRFAFLSQFVNVAANLLHHGAELYLKAALSKDDPAPTIRSYGGRNALYGHSLARLWLEFKRRNPTAPLAAHDATVEALDKFEDIRYPDELLAGGALINFSVETPGLIAATQANPARTFTLVLADVDRLMADLYPYIGFETFVLSMHLGNEQAQTYYNLRNLATRPAVPYVPPAQP